MAKTEDSNRMFIGVLFTICMGLTGAVYATTVTRITNLETNKDHVTDSLSEINTRLTLLKDHTDRTESLLKVVTELQSESGHKLDFLIISSQKAQEWRALVGDQTKRANDQAKTDSKRWNKLIDQQPTPQK